MSVIKFNESNFEEEVLKSDKKVLVDFYADWCGPCKMMSPIIEKIAEEIGDTAKVGKVNSDENMNLAQKYNIMSIPTIMIFKDGMPIKTFIGLTDKNEILNELK